ncbi:MAG: carboxypeptidase-like regulatory domain-containing protein, partial [Paludibacteraceae bacterium]
MALFLCREASAVEIRGVVLDSLTEESLVGATIRIKGESTGGTTTGLDGTFVLRTETAHPVVCCSYMGFESVEVPYEGSRMVIRL